VIRHRIAAVLFSIAVTVAMAALDRTPGATAMAQEPAQSDRDPAEANRAPFALVDHTGRAVTDRDFLGRFLLIFFGYTHCPDVCPMDLAIMSEAVDLLGDEGNWVQPLFITIDPVRDTVAVLANFVGHFHPRLIGLTGTPEQVTAVAKRYHARYQMFTPAEGAEPESYLMDHTAAFYLLGPDGGGLALFNHATKAEDIAAVIRQFIDRLP
jgi:protein SCO1/2